MHVGIIGPGRLGQSLHVLFSNAGHDVDLRGKRDGVPASDVIFLTVPDGAISDTAKRIPTGRTLFHCSGALPHDILRPYTPAGSWHPLMTFPGPEIAIPELDGIPLALSGDPEAISVGRDLALSLSMRPFHVPGDRRLYHAAAVIAGNFATVLLAEASTLLAQAGVPEAECRALLAPLAIESIRNAVAQPNRALTGPIARGDKDVLEAHRAAFRDHELDNMLSLYEELARHAIAICQDKPE